MEANSDEDLCADDLNLYDDLLVENEVLQRNQQIQKDLQFGNLEKETADQKARIDELQTELLSVKRENLILRRNISCLYKTAKLEIDRKDDLLRELQRRYDAFVFRRTDEARKLLGSQGVFSGVNKVNSAMPSSSSSSSTMNERPSGVVYKTKPDTGSESGLNNCSSQTNNIKHPDLEANKSDKQTLSNEMSYVLDDAERLLGYAKFSASARKKPLASTEKLNSAKIKSTNCANHSNYSTKNKFTTTTNPSSLRISHGHNSIETDKAKAVCSKTVGCEADAHMHKLDPCNFQVKSSDQRSSDLCKLRSSELHRMSKLSESYSRKASIQRVGYQKSESVKLNSSQTRLKDKQQIERSPEKVARDNLFAKLVKRSRHKPYIERTRNHFYAGHGDRSPNARALSKFSERSECVAKKWSPVKKRISNLSPLKLKSMSKLKFPVDTSKKGESLSVDGASASGRKFSCSKENATQNKQNIETTNPGVGESGNLSVASVNKERECHDKLLQTSKNIFLEVERGELSKRTFSLDVRSEKNGSNLKIELGMVKQSSTIEVGQTELTRETQSFDHIHNENEKNFDKLGTVKRVLTMDVEGFDDGLNNASASQAISKTIKDTKDELHCDFDGNRHQRSTDKRKSIKSSQNPKSIDGRRLKQNSDQPIIKDHHSQSEASNAKAKHSFKRDEHRSYRSRQLPAAYLPQKGKEERRKNDASKIDNTIRVKKSLSDIDEKVDSKRCRLKSPYRHKNSHKAVSLTSHAKNSHYSRARKSSDSDRKERTSTKRKQSDFDDVEFNDALKEKFDFTKKTISQPMLIKKLDKCCSSSMDMPSCDIGHLSINPKLKTPMPVNKNDGSDLEDGEILSADEH